MEVVPDQESTPRTKLRERIGEQRVEQVTRRQPGAEAGHGGVYVFFSFDLVDATRYKEVDSEGWPLVISRFYELITKSADKFLGRVQLWKLVGDEVLLYKRLQSPADLRICIPGAHEILTDTIERIHREFRTTKPLLSIKGTVWCARVHPVPSGDVRSAVEEFSSSGHRNIIIPHLVASGAPGPASVDFLGPEVDTGFRISRHVTRRRLVVSADVAYLLYRDRSNAEPIEHQLKIVGFQPLKGIWGGRRYPIIWFEKDWDAVRFEYDERFNSDIIEQIERSGPLRPLSALPSIYEDLNRLEDAQALFEYVQSLRHQDDEELEPQVVTAVAGTSVEVHCAAVCFRRDTGQALLARRSPHKRRLPHRWEFGCGQLAPNEGFDDALRRAYVEDFGAHLEFPAGLVPVAEYVLEDPDQRHRMPGLIFVAEITNPAEVRALRHADFRWVDPQDPDELPSEDDSVPDLRSSLRGAAERWRASQNSQDGVQAA